jgi:tetratricopeptide repeat protein
MSKSFASRIASPWPVDAAESRHATSIRAHLIQLATNLQAALAHHRAGRIDQAEALYRKMLDAAPNHPQALRMLGVMKPSADSPRARWS